MTAYDTYTKTDAINKIREALDEYVNDYDVDGMFNELYMYDEKLGGFVEDEDADFWGIANEYDTTLTKANEEWHDAGYYTVAYTDGGMPYTSDGAIWCEYPEDLAALISGANVYATDTHLAVVEYEGIEEA